MGDELRVWIGAGRRRWLAGAAAIVAAAWVVSDYWPRPRAEAAPKVLAMGWSPVFAQSGRGGAQTESFEIDTGQWRIKWTVESGEGLDAQERKFQVGVHSTVSGRLMKVVVDQRGSGDGIAYLAEEPRPFFLSIESSGAEWTVLVEEGVFGERMQMH
ncbi:MAG: hypothetical protein O3A53_05110 [Acidobacteria bacterium]|nr:hypothetical protein [Acidobacteriota bacterium]MDA1234159.1 hypothetical protein [Acidobacteriota bacterium]